MRTKKMIAIAALALCASGSAGAQELDLGILEKQLLGGGLDLPKDQEATPKGVVGKVAEEDSVAPAAAPAPAPVDAPALLALPREALPRTHVELVLILSLARDAVSIEEIQWALNIHRMEADHD